jgi:DNA mismatch repair protein MutS2
VSRHALQVLEFPRVLDVVAGFASSDLAKERLRSLSPSSDLTALNRELARVGALMRFTEEKPTWGMPPVPAAGSALQLLVAEGAVLEPLQIHATAVLLGSSRTLATELDGRDVPYEELSQIRERLVEDRELEKALHRSVDAEGEVLDTASRDLKRIRDRLRGAHVRVVRRLEAYLRTLPERHVVSDASVTVREGRYVIPIRREGKGEVGGIVHDESHTGVTLFVEPPIAIELMNQLRDLEREEAREIRRVLGDLSLRLSPLRQDLEGALDAVVEFDSLLARARAAHAWRGAAPEMVEGGAREWRLVDARHPLLEDTPALPVVPYDLEVLPGERAVVVSGPNTGGKSVFLKAVGLISALAQSGVVPPVGAGTRLPVFTSFFADIGDEQSISQSLSTFSAHLANLSDIVAGADHRSLVLIDEMGTGTDPSEGAALAQAVLEELVGRGAFAVVSSHLSQLKVLAGEGSGIVNASLQFDPDRMEPTFRLVKGRPGRSYGLAIARRLGFPGHVLDRAEGYQEEGEARLEELLEQLERREREAEIQQTELQRLQDTAERTRVALERREKALREAERGAEEHARRDARRLLLEAREEVEAAIEDLRAEAETRADLDEAARVARRRVEEAARRSRLKETSTPGRTSEEGLPTLTEGERVRVGATGAKGTVVEVRATRAVVEAGSLRLEVPIEDLEPIDGVAAQGGRSHQGGWSGPETTQVRTEIDLRGMRVQEVDIALPRALDDAVLEDLSEFRIIHGKGTGALRQRVGELLSEDARVRSHRMGGPTEGGAGVTVVSLS